MASPWFLIVTLVTLGACRERVIVGHDVRLPISIPDREDASAPAPNAADAASNARRDADTDDEMIMMQDANDSASDFEQNDEQTQHD